MGFTFSVFLRGVFAAMAACLICGCSAHAPGMYSFDEQNLIQYLQHNGIECHDIDNYWEDADGRVVYIPTGPRFKGEQITLLRLADDKPMTVRTPSGPRVQKYWIDSRGQTYFLPPYAFSEYDANMATILDDQSGYFFQWRTTEDVVYVGHMQNKSGWLFTFHPTKAFRPAQICARGQNIYFLDHRDRPSPTWFHTGINCWEFSPDPKNPDHYIKADEFSVAGRVEKVDPFSPRFACYGYGYMPFPGRPFLYDTKEHKMIGSLPDDQIVLFLDHDWLTPRLLPVK